MRRDARSGEVSASDDRWPAFARDVFSRADAWIDRIDAESIDPNEGRMPTVAVLLTTAAALTFIRYAGTPDAFRRVTGISALSSDDAQLLALLWWAGISIVGYVAFPLVAMKLFGLGRPRDVGVTVRGLASRLPAYSALLLVTMAAIAIAARSPSFQAVYPFYRPQELTMWKVVLYEAAYGAQFVALEFFFRGFLVHIPKRRFGVLAVLVMVVPYCMIHFRKPLPETIGAIIGGTVLGFASLRTGSIAGGILLHLGVAWGMDALSLWMR